MAVRTSLVLLAVLVVAGIGAADNKAPATPKPKAVEVEAGPLFDNAEAAKTCPTKCKPPLQWNGNWKTVKPGISSVCACAEPAPAPVTPVVKGTPRDVEAGPLFSDDDAKGKCPALCPAPARWSGAWRTTTKGKMSVCTCEDPPPAPRVVATGAIWSSTDARTQCAKACKAPLTWNGEWAMKKPGKAASCECLDPAPTAK